MSNDPFDRLRTICLALPEATEQAGSGAMTAFRVGEKVFAWYLDNHHGDGRIALWCKAPPGAQPALVGSEPERFFVPPYVGHHGWIGIWLDVAVDRIDWDDLTEIVTESYRMTAPKRLLASLNQR
jgi:hypothetical protein